MEKFNSNNNATWGHQASTRPLCQCHLVNNIHIKAWAIWASTQQFESTPNGAKYLIQSQKFHSSYGPTEAKRYYVNIYLRYMGQQYQAERPKPTPPGARRPILDSSLQMSHAE